MKTNYFSIILSVLIILAFEVPTSFAGGGDGVGNGGGKLLSKFEDARQLAYSMLMRINHCSIPDSTKPGVRSWLVQNIPVLLEDILESVIEVQEDPSQGNCALTQPKSKSPIILSHKKCTHDNYSIEEAARLIIHESVHHLGQSQEMFTENVARAISLADINHKKVCPTSAPFDPMSCQGTPLTNSKLSARKINEDIQNLGKFKTYLRVRFCERAGECSQWLESQPQSLTLYNRVGIDFSIEATGEASLSKDSATEEYIVRALKTDAVCAIEGSKCVFSVGGDVPYLKLGESFQPLILNQTVTNNCLRQDNYFFNHTEKFLQNYQLVIFSSF